MERPEYFRIKVDDTPPEYMEEYNLEPYIRDGWVYFKILCG